MSRSTAFVSVVLAVLVVPTVAAQGWPLSPGHRVLLDDAEDRVETPAAVPVVDEPAGAPDTAPERVLKRRPRADFTVRSLTSPWLVTAGGSLNSFTTRAAWSPRGLAGTLFLVEDTLGLDEQTSTAFVRVTRRINRRHSIVLSVADLDRTARRVIDTDIEWGDYLFRAHGEVTSKLTTRVANLTWRYDFSDSERLNAGFSAGLATFDLGLRLEGEARLENEAGGSWVKGAVEGADVVAPLPVVGFYLEYALAPTWILRFNTEAIDLDLGTTGGRLLQTQFAFEHAFSDLFGVGLGLGGIDLQYFSGEGDEQFGVSYRIKSLSAYASFAF